MADARPKYNLRITDDTYFHYTDLDSAKKIEESGYIKASAKDQNDAKFGEGTYLTKVKPTLSHTIIAKNNWDHAWKGKEGKTKALFVVQTDAKKCSKDRDVYLHDGNIPKEDIKAFCIRDDDGKVRCRDFSKGKR